MPGGQGDDGRVRCDWSLYGSERLRTYHDEEWGVPVRDDRALFAKLILDGAQAGLSWQTILHRQEGYLRALRQYWAPSNDSVRTPDRPAASTPSRSQADESARSSVSTRSATTSAGAA